MLVLIRGNACSGKSTVAEKLRNSFKDSKKTAVVHTTIFDWGIVEGDKPGIVMENTKIIIENYLKNNYDVVLEGSTLSNKDKEGKLYLEWFLKLAEKYNTPIKQFFLKANFEVIKKRKKTKKQISLKKLKEFYDRINKTKRKEEIVIDTSHKSIKEVIDEVKKNLF